jgi:capsular exopolysaccharide synthesis family protein
MGRVQQAMRRAAGEVPDQPALEEAAEIGAPSEVEETTTALVPASEFDIDEMRASSDETAPASGEAALTADPGSELITRFNQRYAAKVVIDHAMLASSREQYRRLAAALHHAREASGMQVVMIASAVAGEGKSLTASNLAMTFSESYKRSVLLIDGDLRRPSIHTLFGIESREGLSEALLSIDEPQLSLIQVSDRLTILPGGRPNSDPMAGLVSGRMQRLINEARELFDWVFIDTPPVGLLSDANLLAAMVDAALLVIRADRTPYPLVQRAIESLGRDRLLGTVLNQSTAQSRGNYYEYYHYYQAPRGVPTTGA